MLVVELIVDHISSYGRFFINYINSVGKATSILFSSIFTIPSYKYGIRGLIKQLYFVGVWSLIIIILSGIFIGMVLGLQGYTILVKFGAEQALGQMVALSLVRELGPVMTALLFAGRAGSALTAEIGLMKATEQLSSMEMMGVDPLKRVVAPRFWAGQISMPILALIFNAVAIIAGYYVGVEWLGVDYGSFWSNMQNAVDFRTDIFNGIIKSIIFGGFTTWIAVFQGFDCEPTSAGISRATTNTVVFSSLVILALDFFLTAVMFR
jgi:phospholipid/cholesterol/gamma-HCH transport system permease protein